MLTQLQKCDNVTFAARKLVLNRIYPTLHKLLWDGEIVKADELAAIINKFRVDTNYTLDELPTTITPFDGDGHIMSLEDWVIGSGFLPCDGCGYWATDDGYSYAHSELFDYQPKWATQVVWYNK